MKSRFLLFFYFFTQAVLSQGETNIWYFGDRAGLNFNSGTPLPLTDGQLVTLEGCATISNSFGKLLFYTDGKTIYNRNHQLMNNGSGLMGDLSTSQSATIVPMPGSTSLYYVFTLDAGAGAAGFRYSVVDINLDGGLGAVTTEKNVLIYTPSCEKIAIVKHANNTDFWIITHGFDSNIFYSHLLTASGLNLTPVTSSSGTIVSRDSKGYNSMGYMKVSPNGTKLALCHQFLYTAELFDFNNLSGTVSNPNILISNAGQLYGLEFSPNSEVLYVASQITKNLYQFDLKAANVAASMQLIKTLPNFLGALQLGPDGKIYIATYEQNKLSVITAPNILGSGCDLQINSIDLAGKICKLGLPAFNQSFFFKSDIQVTDTCEGDSSQFILNSAQTVTSSIWDFGDGNTSNAFSPVHTYATSGTYTVTVTGLGSSGSTTVSKQVIISKVPTASIPGDLLICDNNNDGLFTFDLTVQNTSMLNGQAPGLYTIKFFANAVDFSNNLVITTPTSYTNTIAYKQETIIAEISNNANPACKTTTSFTIDVFDSPLPNLPSKISSLTICDSTSIGTDTDGKVIFDLTQRANLVLNGQLGNQFSLSYYKDAALKQNIVLPVTYQNTNSIDTIYVKMANIENPACYATTSFVIEVFALPVINAVVDLKQCDEDIDGFSMFNLEEAISKITYKMFTETVSFYKTIADAQNNANIITNVTTYTNQMISNDVVYVRVTNENSCFKIAKLNLIVSTTKIPLNFSKTITQCDDNVSGTNSDGIASFDFSSLNNQIQNIFPVGQLLDITYYKNLNDALAEKNVIKDISNYRNIGYPNTQKIYIRVDSKINNDCLGLGSHLTLNVEKMPIAASLIETQCDDDQDGIYSFDTSTVQSRLLNGLTDVTVTYYDENNLELSSPLPNPFKTSSQTLKAKVTNNTSTACSFDTTIDFVVSDLPEAFAIKDDLTTICDDEVEPSLQNGKYAFDTSTFQSTILGEQIGMVVKYYDQNNKVLPSPLPNPFITASQNIRVEVTNPFNARCSANTMISFVINPLPVIRLIGDELVCSNLNTFTKIIDAGLHDPSLTGNYRYVWSYNGEVISGETNYSLTVNRAGLYTIDVFNNYGCSSRRKITVSASDIAKIIDVNTVDLSTINSISISVTGFGDYVFAIDDEFGTYQKENFFNNVSAGIHTIFVKDLNGCGIVLKEVSVLGIPNYFTPNGDGFNDHWNIKGVNSSFNAKTMIHVFDRYGKMIHQISPLDQGWDGMSNGQQMPASDYWYSIQLEDGRIMKGHFTLKR